MKNIKVLRTRTNGIRFSFMLNGQRFDFCPVKDGRFDNPSHYGQAYAIAHKISSDIAAGLFDTTLTRYKPAPTAVLEAVERQKDIELKSLWTAYIEGRKSQVSQSTYAITYGAVTRCLEACPYTRLDEAKAVRDWILVNKPPITAKKLLVQLNACLKNALEDGVIESNPLSGFQKMLNKKAINTEREIDPFSDEEKRLILKVFEDDKKLRHYYALIRFLFAVGCRPSEAIALEWKDIQRNQIVFSKAYVNGTLNKRLKTQEQRIVTQNESVRFILENWRSEFVAYKFTASNLVFPGYRGKGYIDWSNFTHKVWQPTLQKLEGVRYRSPYQMRHTFITAALKVASVQDVARHCGNSPEVIFRHYAGVSKGFVMPDV